MHTLPCRQICPDFLDMHANVLMYFVSEIIAIEGPLILSSIIYQECPSICKSSSLECPSGMIKSNTIGALVGRYLLVHVEALMKVVYPSEVTPYPKVPKKMMFKRQQNKVPLHIGSRRHNLN